ncbi:MAG: amidohydrolase [Terriglobia bacterium]|nr:MAG: amidohydrolase [Terriglobia bacterium]
MAFRSTSRRKFVAGLAAAGAGAVSPGWRLRAQSGNPRVIDCHHHFVSPAFLKTLTAKQGRKLEGFTNYFPLGLWQNYSPARDIELMDKQGVATAMISVTSPGVWFGDREEARKLAREMNEYGAKMASDYKGRFGLFALLPLPLIDESLREIEYAFDTLKADGVGILTSYGNRWLGDAAFQPVFDELNRRKAIVYTHPIDAPCCQDLWPDVNPTTLEFPTDTARAILSLLVTNAASRYGDIRFIFSHGGGTMPAVIGRLGIGGADTLTGVLNRPAEPNSRLFQLRRFCYDTAMSTNVVQMQALKTIAGVSQIVFGTDYPFGGDAARHLTGLQSCGLSDEDLRAIQRGNAAKFLPKYAG